MKTQLLALTVAALFTTGVAYAQPNYDTSRPTGNITFKDFDLNKDGVISKQEIQQVRTDANQMLQYMDNRDQQTMDQSEFSKFEVSSEQGQPQSQQNPEPTYGGLIPG